MTTSIGNLRVIVVAALCALSPCEVAGAQRAQPLGIQSRSEFSSARESLPPNKADDWKAQDFVTWTGVGVIVGGVAGGVWAAVQMAHTDDVMLPGLGMAIGIGGGAIIGGLVGAFAYVVSHSPHASK